MFNQQDRHFVSLIDGLHDVKNLSDNERCQAKRRFVQQQQSGAQHEGPCNGQHLLLTPGKCAGLLIAPFLQPRKVAVHLFLVLRHLLLVFSGVAAQLQIFFCGKAAEGATAVGHVSHTQSNNVLRGLAFNGLTIKHDLTANFDHLAQRTQRGGFTGTVGT